MTAPLSEISNLFNAFGRVYRIAKHMQTRQLFVAYASRREAINSIDNLHHTYVLRKRVKVFRQPMDNRLCVRNVIDRGVEAMTELIGVLRDGGGMRGVSHPYNGQFTITKSNL